MARDRVAMARDGRSVADPVVQRYLADLSRVLPGPRRACLVVVDEIADGLHEAIARHSARGLRPPAAAAAAVDEFGEPAVVAAAFAGELAIARARAVVAAFVLTGPLVGVWWLLLLLPRPLPPDLTTLGAALPVLPVVAAATITAVAIRAATGSLTRWLPEIAPGRALDAGAAIGLACMASDVTMLGILAARAAGAPDSLSPALAAAAVTASLVRLSFAAMAVHRGLRARRAVP